MVVVAIRKNIEKFIVVYEVLKNKYVNNCNSEMYSRCGRHYKFSWPAKKVKCNKCGHYNNFSKQCKTTIIQSIFELKNTYVDNKNNNLPIETINNENYKKKKKFNILV